jgi:sugar O-acyltransferase (sialic acid O-acetyltransferase NeuD family)
MNLLIYCAGGFGREVMDIARRLNRAHARWDRIAFLDDECAERDYYGASVFRLEDAIAGFKAGTVEAAIATGEPFLRKAILEKLDAAGIGLTSLIDDAAVISETAAIGVGAIVFPGCFVSSMAILGRNVAIVAGSTIGHDSVFGDNCVVSGQVNLGGQCRIGSESFIGMGAQVRGGTRIGQGVIVGMGSVVFADIPDEVIALGNPCRPMQPNASKRIFQTGGGKDDNSNGGNQQAAIRQGFHGGAEPGSGGSGREPDL